MLMLYFSGTGNSAYIARQFSDRMRADCYSIEDEVEFEQIMEKHDTIAVCYPIYGSCVPKIMRDFVAEHRRAFLGKSLIIFCTQMMFSGDGARAFSRLMPASRSRVIYAEHFSMPNNISNFKLFPIGNRERIRKRKAADRKLKRVCNEIQNGIVRKRGFSPLSALSGKLQNSYWPLAELSMKSSFHTGDGCISCGRCVRFCPVKNLSMEDGSVIQHDKCILCYRCVNLCPSKVISVMLKGKPTRQYKGVLGSGKGSFWNGTC